MGANARRGSALLAVLWLSAALGAIAFSLAATVRGELEHTSTTLDGTRAYYLATGAIQRALFYMQWEPAYKAPDGSSRYFPPGTSRLRFSFPTGEAIVEIAPETAKLGLNRISPEDLTRLLSVLGAGPGQAIELTRAILDWRAPLIEAGPTEFDLYYQGLTPSFRAPHASFQHVEELLAVKGMTPELFFGSLARDPRGGLAERPGLMDCLSVYANGAMVDANTAAAPVLATVGLDEGSVRVIVEARRRQPFRSTRDLAGLGLRQEALARLTIGGGPVYTLRATARLRLADGKLSDLSRTAGATVSLEGGPASLGYQVLRWRDWAWTGNEAWTPEPSLQ
jgi:general secretion pathway protein K